MSMGVEARCRPSKRAAHCCHMKRQPFLHGRPCRSCLLCHRHRHLRLRLHLRCHCRHHCRRNRPLPLPLPWAIAAVAVNHCCRPLCCVAVSHCCCHCPCRLHHCQPLQLPSRSAINVAMPLAISESCCLGMARIVFDQSKQRMLTFLYCWDSGRCLDQSRITYQVSSGNGQHQRWVASGEQ